MLLFGIISGGIYKKISDSFNRVTESSLSVSSSGRLWGSIRGSWFSNGSRAQSNDSASSYPITSINVSTNVKASASVTPGTGVAFWVTDSGSWWASAYVQENYSSSYSYPCSDCYYNGCKTCSSYTCAGACGNATSGSADTMNCSCNNGYTTQSCPYASYPYLSGGKCWNRYFSGYTSPAVSTVPSTYNCACGNAVAARADTNNCGCCCQAGYNCYPSTCTASSSGTNNFLRLINSVGGVVSTVTSDISLSATAAAIFIETNQNTVTMKAYSDESMTSQIGSTITYSATLPIKGQGAGIIKVPSDNQNSIVGNFKAEL